MTNSQGVISFILVSSFFYYGCSGCSHSGINARRQSVTNDAKLSSSESTDNLYTPSQYERSKSLNEWYKIYANSVFLVFTSDGDQGSQGSGFFISSDGLALSNYHVFKGTTKGLEKIQLPDGSIYKVESVLASEEKHDYIIFKIFNQNNEKFIPIPIAESNPEIGDEVFAIGNPLGLENTLSTGIISGFRLHDSLVQTTTEITHGSSGGPLINMYGQAIGITSSGYGQANLNFAMNVKYIPVSYYKNE